MTKTKRTIPAGSSVLEALQAINALSGDAMTLFVVDVDGRVAGSVTDGDIRRALIAGTSLAEPISLAMNRNFMSVAHDENTSVAIARARKKHITLLPVLDADGKIERLIDLRIVKCDLPVDAVLMAGGRGERLRPLTLDCPKPLLKVGDKAIIDYNVANLASCGIDNIYVTVNYLREQIEEHFSLPVEGAEVKCIAEPKRLGTMGSLALVPTARNPETLVMNSDLLTSLDFEQMYLHHKRSEADLTMAAIPYNVSVPFAIMHTEGDRVLGLSEKPTYNYFANAGVYLMKSELRERIAADTYLDAPDFILSLIADGLKVSFFPVNGTWIDIGSPDDYRYANELMNTKI